MSCWSDLIWIKPDCSGDGMLAALIADFGDELGTAQI
ncbi:hypothetical protein GGD65_006506 [Bradyrhizobium sp. CIR18]|nr:hypothetical protein [Bradyrhizobium sp. CIR18]